MHHANMVFWTNCSKKYPNYFGPTATVLEIGSGFVNGSIRSVFDKPAQYIGVDWRPGFCVDHVCLAHEMDFKQKFSSVVTSSMLEHDPYWDKSVAKMVEHLADDGILIITCGGAREGPHELHTAPDGKFHGRPAGLLLNLLASLGVYVHEFLYEAQLDCKGGPPGKWGEICLVAFKDPKYAVGPQSIASLLPEDVA